MENNIKHIPFDGGDKMIFTKESKESSHVIHVEYKQSDGIIMKFTIPFENESDMNHYYDNDGGGIKLKKYLDYQQKINPEDSIRKFSFDSDTFDYEYIEDPSNTLMDFDKNMLDFLPSEQFPDLLIKMLDDSQLITLADYKSHINGYVNALKDILKYIENNIGVEGYPLQELIDEGYQPAINNLINEMAGYSKGVDFGFDLIMKGMDISNKNKIIANTSKKNMKSKYNLKRMSEEMPGNENGN